MEPAKAPEAPIERLPYRNMALAGLGAMLLPFLVLRLLGKRVGKSELSGRTWYSPARGPIFRRRARKP